MINLGQYKFQVNTLLSDPVITITDINLSGFTINWNNVPDATQYHLTVNSGSTTGTTIYDGDLNGDVFSKVMTGLTSNMTYYINFFASNDNITSNTITILQKINNYIVNNDTIMYLNFENNDLTDLSLNNLTITGNNITYFDDDTTNSSTNHSPKLNISIKNNVINNNFIIGVTDNNYLLPSNFTYSIWAIRNNNNGFLLDIIDNAIGNIEVKYDSSSCLTLSGSSSGIDYIVKSSPKSVNIWDNIVVTRDNNNFSLYINAALIGTTTIPNYINNFKFFNGNILSLVGGIDELIIEGTTWNQSKITQYYNNLKV